MRAFFGNRRKKSFSNLSDTDSKDHNNLEVVQTECHMLATSGQNSIVTGPGYRASFLLYKLAGLTPEIIAAEESYRFLAKVAIGLCGLAGYDISKISKVLHTLPEYSLGSEHPLPVSLNIEGIYRGIQQRRSQAYMAYIKNGKVDPMQHRLDADNYMFEVFGEGPAEDAELHRELQHWVDTWKDEITISGFYDEQGRIAATHIRTALEPFLDISVAVEHVRSAHQQRLQRSRASVNLERFDREFPPGHSNVARKGL
jgi:hypothetical protein